MKKSTKVLLGVATIWPVLYICFFHGFDLRAGHFWGLTWWTARTGSILLPLVSWLDVRPHDHHLWESGPDRFLHHQGIKMKSLNENMKIMWVLLLYFAAMLAEPVFWYLYIWRETPESALPNQSAQLGPGLGSTWSTQTAAPRSRNHLRSTTESS